MSEYKALCYALQHAVRATKLRYRERIECHFQLNDSRHMCQGLRTICSFGNKSSAEVRADPLLADKLNTFYVRFECNGGSVTVPISVSGSSRQSSNDDVITVSEDEVRRELKRVKQPDLIGLLAMFCGPVLISLLVCLLQSLMSYLCVFHLL